VAQNRPVRGLGLAGGLDRITPARLGRFAADGAKVALALGGWQACPSGSGLTSSASPPALPRRSCSRSPRTAPLQYALIAISLGATAQGEVKT